MYVRILRQCTPQHNANKQNPKIIKFSLSPFYSAALWKQKEGVQCDRIMLRSGTWLWTQAGLANVPRRWETCDNLRTYFKISTWYLDVKEIPWMQRDSEFFWGKNCPSASLSIVWQNSTPRQKYLQVGEGEVLYWTIQMLLLYCICNVIILQTIQCNGFLQSIHTALGVIRDREMIRGIREVCRSYVRAKLCSIGDMRIYRVCYSWGSRDPVLNY